MSTDRYTVFVGGLPYDCNEKDIKGIFHNYSIRDINIRDSKTSGAVYGYVEFRHSADARDAVKYVNGKEFQGNRLKVDFKKPYDYSRSSSSGHQSRSYGTRFLSGIDSYKHRCSIRGLPTGINWRELKGLLRKYCTSDFCDVVDEGSGVIGFSNSNDMMYAMEKLNSIAVKFNDKELCLKLTDLANDRSRRKGVSKERRKTSSKSSSSNHNGNQRSPVNSKSTSKSP